MMPGGSFDIVASAVGRENALQVCNWLPFDSMARWLRDLPRRIEEDPADLRADWVQRFEEWLNGSSESSSEDQFAHSRKFWMNCLTKLPESARAWIATQHGQATRGPVRPEAILVSHEMATWLHECRLDLETRFGQGQLFAPQAQYYRRGLVEAKRSFENLPKSAAVQRNLVVGLLGHGMLESLDEYVLILHEIVNALGPRVKWLDDELASPLDGETADVERNFHNYIRSCADKAQGVPRGLRAVQELLGARRTDTHSTTRYTMSQALMSSQQGVGRMWEINVERLALKDTLSSEEFHFLGHCFRELAWNDHCYGHPDRTPCIVVKEGCVNLHFYFSTEEQHIGGARVSPMSLLKKIEKDLQALGQPHPNPMKPSHGMGLYLANFGAALAGWMLRIERVEQCAESVGVLAFQLKKKVHP